MKNHKASILAALLLATVSAQAQTAEEVVKKYLNAIGGEAAWKKVNSVKATGSINAQGAEIKLSFVTVNGKGYRTDYNVMGMTGYSIITPAAGWYFNPGAGQKKAEAMKEEQVLQSQAQLDAQGELVDYKAKGNTVEYLGKEKLKGLDCYKLQITLKSGSQETWFIDAATNYLVRASQKLSAHSGDQEKSTDFGDYKKLPEGIYYPMAMTTSNGEVKLSSVEINTSVDEKIFTPAG